MTHNNDEKSTVSDVDVILKGIASCAVVCFVTWLVIKLFWWIVGIAVVGGVVWYNFFGGNDTPDNAKSKGNKGD